MDLLEAQIKFGYKNVKDAGLFTPILVKNGSSWYPLLSDTRLTKDQLISTKIAKKYHPNYKNVSKKWLLETAYTIRTEKIFEQCLALCCPYYDWIDTAYKDFSDDTDGKTTTVRHRGKIDIHAIGNKVGALRTLVYNPYTENLDYFFLPVDRKIGSIFIDKRGITRLSFNWSYSKNNYGAFEQYRVKSFEDLAWIKAIENDKFIYY